MPTIIWTWAIGGGITGPEVLVLQLTHALVTVFGIGDSVAI